MIQRREHFRFALKPREPIRVGRERGGQNLDGDLAFELGVRRAVDLTHSAFADERSDFVSAEASAGREGQWWRLYGRDGANGVGRVESAGGIALTGADALQSWDT